MRSCRGIAAKQCVITGADCWSARPDGASRGLISGALFKVTRESADLTQQDLADALGVDKSTVQGWETGRRPLTSARAGTLVAHPVRAARPRRRPAARRLPRHRRRSRLPARPAPRRRRRPPPVRLPGVAAAAVRPARLAAQPEPAPRGRRSPPPSSPRTGHHRPDADRRTTVAGCWRTSAAPPRTRPRRPTASPRYAARSPTWPRSTAHRPPPDGWPTSAPPSPEPTPAAGSHPAGPKPARSPSPSAAKATPTP